MAAFLQKAAAFIVSALLTLFSFWPAFTACLSDKTNNYDFAVDAAKTGAVYGNKLSNINSWSAQGVPAQSDFIESDPMQFVEYIQLMQCTGGSAERDLFLDPYDRSVKDDYNFAPLIAACENVLALGAKPHLKTGNVPLKLTTDPKLGVFGVNVYPPDDYNEYFTYIAAITQALVAHFGLAEVQSWRFGVLTEYENKDWFYAKSETPQDSLVAYCKLYDYTLAALQSVLGETVDIGAHSMSVAEGLWDEGKFIEHCAKGSNYYTGQQGSRLCFLSASYYDSNTDKLSDRNVVEVLEALRSKAQSVGLDNLIYGVDEGRILSGTKGKDDSALNLRIVGHSYQAAYDARMLTMLSRAGFDYFSSWGYLSGGLFSGYPSVAYHVADRYAALLADKASAETSVQKTGYMQDTEVDVLAGTDSASGNVSLMAYNFRPKLAHERSADVTVSVKLPAGYGATAAVTEYRVDDSANYFDEWMQDRARLGIGDDAFAWSPDDPAIDTWTTLNAQWARDVYYNELRAGYIEAARLIPTTREVPVEDGCITLSFPLDANTAIFFDIAK